MAWVVWHHLRCTVTWLTRMVLVLLLSVTTVRAEQGFVTAAVMESKEATHVTFTTQERVCLSRRVSSAPPHIASSLSSTSAIVQWYSEAVMLGGCHVILLRWRTGVEHHLAVVSAHAGWTTHVQTPSMAVTVIRMTQFGVRTAVSSLTRHIFQ